MHGNIRHGFVYERVPHITLKSIANNAEIDVIWEKWQAKLEPLRETLNAALKKTLAGVGDSTRGRCQVAGRGEEAARRLVAGPHRPAEGDRRLHRRQGRVRIPLRQALRRQEEGPRGRAVHRREPLARTACSGVDENDELIDTRGGSRRRLRSEADLSPDDPGEPQDRRRAAGAQGGPDHLHRAHPLARRPGLRRRPLPGRRRREKRAAIFIGPEFGTVTAPRPGRRRPRGRRCRLRRADRLRLQLRGPRHRVQQARPHPRAQGPHERRPAHGRGPQEHRQGQPLRHLRRAGHRPPRRRRTASCA